MQLNYPHNDINRLINFSKKLQLINNKKKLPKVIIIFNEKKFNKEKYSLLKIPKGSAILLRSYNSKERMETAKKLLKFCKINKLKLLIARDIKLARKIKADGVHLPQYMIYNKSIVNWQNFNLMKIKLNWVVTAAAHNKKTLYEAKKKRIDAALLSPVFRTKSHPNRNKLGIARLANWIKEIKIPVYALGGINLDNIIYLKDSGITGFAFQRGYK